MRVEVVMPQMGESIVEGTVVAWIKKVGDLVERDEDIFTLTTDKVDAEVPSPAAGRLVEIIAQPGQTVEVGRIVAYIETEITAAAPAPATQALPAVPVASATVTSPASTAAVISAPLPPIPAAPKAVPVPTTTLLDPPDGALDRDTLRRTRSTPLVRKIAAEHGLTDLSAVPATGVSGRVTRDDLLRFIADGGPAKAAAPASATPAVPATAASTKSTDDGDLLAIAAPASGKVAMADFGVPAGYDVALVKSARVVVSANDTVEPMSRMRASIAENMIQARRSTAHCHTVWEADVTHILRLRDKHRADFEARGAKLTLTAFFVEAVADALRAFPAMNSAIDRDRVVRRGNINVGVASAIEGGLIVPVVKQVDGLNLFGIARAVNDLAARSKANKLVPADVADGTFTISNSGVFGSLFGVPILVPPQVGILNIGGVKKRVVVDEADNLRIRSMCHLCLTFDHRLIDGATADGFVGHIVKRLAEFVVR